MTSDFVERGEYIPILARVSDVVRLALTISLETGLRIGDVCKIQRKDIRGDVLTYVAEKTGKRGTKVLPHELAIALKARCHSGYIFASRAKCGHLTRQAVFAAVKKARLDCACSAHITPHSARKTYAVDVRRREGFAAAQAALQHSSAAVTALYAFSDGGGARTLSAAEIEIIAARAADIVLRRLQKNVDNVCYNGVELGQG